MNQTIPSVIRPLQRALAILAASCALCAALASTPALHAQSAVAAAKALPLKHQFRKVKDAEAGPYTLKLTNTSSEPLKVSAQVLLAVAFHATDKARNVPEETIAPGKSWTIKDLATDDKITVKADGYDSLQLTVPGKKK